MSKIETPSQTVPYPPLPSNITIWQIGNNKYIHDKIENTIHKMKK